MTLTLTVLVISEVGQTVGPEGDGDEQTGEKNHHIQSKKDSSNQDVDSAVAPGEGVPETTTSSTTDATPASGLIFQPGPMPETDGSNLGRGK